MRQGQLASPGTVGTWGPYGQHMAMLLNDGQGSIIDASGVEFEIPQFCSPRVHAKPR